jgi:hypothetical protein
LLGPQTALRPPWRVVFYFPRGESAPRILDQRRGRSITELGELAAIDGKISFIFSDPDRK